MKDQFEEFVRSHKEEFDVFEPSEKIWEGIERKTNSGRTFHLSYYLVRAAGIAAIFLITLTAQNYFFRNNNIKSEIKEIQEAELYYTGIIDAKLDEVKPLLNDYPEIQNEIDADLSELDSVYNDLKKDLRDNVSNQEVVQAMLDNYRMRVDILEEMLEYLESKKSENTTNKISL